MPLIRLFLDICLFKKGPQDVPASRFLFGLALLAFAVVGLVLTGIGSDPYGALLQVSVELALLLVFAWVTLAGMKLHRRFLQTGTAMLATDGLISALAIPVLLWMSASGSDASAPGYPVLLLLMFWHFAVVAHILRHALTCALPVAIVMAIVYIGGSYQIMVMLFAPPA
ncbi:hypothetical protein [Methylococcus sp. EFPC2]|uniref:hypothetical protein n=1 Tax=Methylococcus sp. EFPC2 TaxID=2812648 RepID=UPI001968052D|nr:hypothetical protein [Methylococcus sp. EFPC2]QSA98597.1 hypothetical protein JWZ97_07325 [Methylococcus sp. EFPC2]